jgi:hypothetical protein
MQSPYYLISNCSSGTTYVVSFLTEAPLPGEAYYLTFTGTTPSGCYSIVSTDLGPDVDEVATLTAYVDCFICLTNNKDVTGTSVDSQYEYTNECCDPASGSTGSGSVVPHPTYSNDLGTPLVQLNMVELGGFNGLNN